GTARLSDESGAEDRAIRIGTARRGRADSSACRDAGRGEKIRGVEVSAFETPMRKGSTNEGLPNDPLPDNEEAPWSKEQQVHENDFASPGLEGLQSGIGVEFPRPRGLS